MKINCIYYGQITELTGKKEESFIIEGKMSLGNFKSFLINQIPNLYHLTYTVAAKDEILRDDFVLHNEIELHIMPPFAGG